jgi:negative regulator of flagellin synthesis FlgM
MKIGQVGSVQNAYQQNNVTAAYKAEKTSQKDKVNFSEEALDFQKAFQAAKAASDIRPEKVEKIKEALASGTYNVDAREVSKKILGELDIKG